MIGEPATTFAFIIEAGGSADAILPNTGYRKTTPIQDTGIIIYRGRALTPMIIG